MDMNVDLVIAFLWNSDQLPVSTKFDMRSDPGVVRNYGRLLLEMVTAVPDGIVCFFVSYSYMDGIVNSWNEMGILQVCIISYLPQFAGLSLFNTYADVLSWIGRTALEKCQVGCNLIRHTKHLLYHSTGSNATQAGFYRDPRRGGDHTCSWQLQTSLWLWSWCCLLLCC